MMFREQIGKTMEVYVDDMLIKSKIATDYTPSQYLCSLEKVSYEAEPVEVHIDVCLLVVNDPKSRSY